MLFLSDKVKNMNKLLKTVPLKTMIGIHIGKRGAEGEKSLKTS